MSEQYEFILAVIDKLSSLFGPLLTAVVGYYVMKMNKQAREDSTVVQAKLEDISGIGREAHDLAKQVKKEATVVQEKLEDISGIGKEAHSLANSNLRTQLQFNAVVSRRLANVTKDPKDREAAEHAERLVREHDEKK